ncbi:MAG: glycosyltransferase family 39 protein [Paracoccaceae bacterium]|nr:MAG: glycosyltransferase family 39 protein [Paracoccaceae bacterium]
MPSTSITRPVPRTDRIWDPARAALAVALALVVWRLALGLLDRTELSTDEAQYWFWGQSPDFGAYSKPPLIGWIIRASTDLFGQSVAAVRLPAVLMHAATAAVIFGCAIRLVPQSVAWLAALLYLVSPAVALGSALMTTDTPLLLAASLALLAQLRGAEANARGQRSPGAAVLLGLALGLGLLAKHAMLFWLLGATVAAFVSPAFRLARADLLLAVGIMTVVVAPHLVWLAQHGFITFRHIGAITEGHALSLLRPLRFLAEQFIVAGPICLAAMVLALRDRSLWGLGALALALAPLLVVVAQGVKGPVLANWAVLYLVPGTILAAQVLRRYRWLAGLSLVLGLAVSVALPLAKAAGTDLQRPDGRPVLSRYLGHSGVANWALDTAAAQGADVLIATDRDLLADLSWFSAGSVLAIRALPPNGLPAHHWEMTAPFHPDDGLRPLVLLRSGTPLPCDDGQVTATMVAPPGFAGGEVLLLYRPSDPGCLAPTASER